MSKPAEKLPPRPALQLQVKEAYRQAILDAAEVVFVNSGFHEAKISDIANLAGVATGTVYNYFRNKDHVFEALAERGKAELVACIEPATHIEAPIERLQETLYRALTFIEARGPLVKLHLERENSRIACLSQPASDESAREYLYNLFDTGIIQAQNQQLIRGDISNVILLNALVAFTEGVVATWLLNDRKEPLPPQAELILRLFMQGASK